MLLFSKWIDSVSVFNNRFKRTKLYSNCVLKEEKGADRERLSRFLQ